MAKSIEKPFVNLGSVDYIPFTIAYAIRKMQQLDTFAELPEDKVPPRSIWHNEYKLNQWFKDVFKRNSRTSTDEFYIDLDEAE